MLRRPSRSVVGVVGWGMERQKSSFWLGLREISGIDSFSDLMINSKRLTDKAGTRELPHDSYYLEKSPPLLV